MRYRYIAYKYARKTGPDPMFQNVWDSFNYWVSSSASVWRPPTDVYETRGDLIILVELAGVPEENIDVTLFDDLLVVEGDRRQPSIPTAGMSACHQLGIKYGMFRSEILLPYAVDRDSVRAEYRNGMLTITLKKAELP